MAVCRIRVQEKENFLTYALQSYGIAEKKNLFWFSRLV